MKYKSIRFFIQINSLLGYGVIYGGILLSLIGAMWLGIAVGGAGGFFLFILTLTIGGTTSVFLGLLIFALGDLFQCFIDIEENTQRTVSTLKETNSNRRSIVETDKWPATQTNLSREESSPGTVTYMCPNCNRFQNSDVIKCENCGAANPHHPLNKSKPDTSEAL